jgi:hypothetical protein
VEAESSSRSVALEIAAPTVRAPVRDVSETPPVTDVVMVAEVVTVAQLTVKSDAMLMAPEELVKIPDPAHVKVKLFVELLVSPVDTAMLPALSIVTFLAVMAEIKSSARMFVADAPSAWKTPSINLPAVVPELVIEIEVATNVGVTDSEVPTNASAVTVKVWEEPPTPVWKPMFEKVATPSREVVVVDVMFVMTPPIVCWSMDPLAAVRVTCWLAPV